MFARADVQKPAISGFRLSPQQRRLWLLQENNSAYRSQFLLLIEGHLKTEVLRQAIRRIIDRHDILRTTFHRLPGLKIPVQVVSHDNVLLWHEIDLRGCRPQETEANLQKIFQQARALSFDFERGPLLRVFLLTLSSERHALIISLPSLCSDAWTLKNLLSEVTQFYDLCSKLEDQCEEPMQYIQFAEWQNQLLEDEASEAGAGKEYWRKRDLSAFAPLTLPSVSNCPGNTRFEPEFLEMPVDPDLSAKIEAMGHDTAASFLRACWHTLLCRLSLQSDIVVGDVYHGRELEVLRESLGLFEKWLPVHSRFERDVQFGEIVHQIDDATRDDHEWQEYFNWGDSAEPEGNASEVGFFPIGFEFEDRPTKYHADNLSFSVYKQYCYTERFLVKVSCVRVDGALTLEFHYDTGRFQLEEIKRLARHFDVLLKTAVDNPQTAVSDLEILSGSDKHQLVVEFNDTASEYLEEKSIHQLFEQQVERTPDSIAVVFENQRLSYAELNARVNQVGHYLRSLGIGPEVLVGLCMGRSLNMMIGLLGILKAGGAYVPMNPSHPKERLAFVMEDARLTVVLTEQSVLTNLPEHKTTTICLDSDWDSITCQSVANPVGSATAENLAYVIYTSGSTGRPKGAMIEQRSLVNLARALQAAIYSHYSFPLKVALNAPLAFDASVKQVLQLLYGHTLYILPDEVRLDGREMLRYVRRNRLNVLDCTPSQLKLLLAVGLEQSSDLAPLLVLVGGEMIDEATWSLLVKSDTIDFYNVYGPTECTVDATISHVRSASSGPIIGRPIINTQAYFLDDHLKLAPIGSPGELHISGSGLARCYLNRPEATAEKFIPNGFSNVPGARLYKTGDLGCYLPDGTIKFLGRIDNQVKIRGYRIELEEVEAVLSQHPGVQQAAVIAREEVPGDKRLVAYVVLSEPAPTINELRDFMKQLPDYMVPSTFVTLTEMPLTRSGKVDRQTLPQPEALRPNLDETYVEPKTAMERIIADLWQAVLQLDKVGVSHNFFDLGGHSLLMVQIHGKLREILRKDVSIIDLFRYPTVSSLAAYLAAEQAQPSSLNKPTQRAEKRRRARIRQAQLVREGRRTHE